MDAIAIIVFVLIVGAFVIFLIKEHLENRKYRKNTMTVHDEYGKIKFIDKSEYEKYKKTDQEVSKKIKDYNEWFESLDRDRSWVYLMEKRGFYYELGVRGDYLYDYINGKIDKDEFERKLDEELNANCT